jgi:hypothetical protein
MDNLPKTVKDYAETLVTRMRDLPLGQRVNFPNSTEQTTFNAIGALLTTDTEKPQNVDDSTPDLGQKVTEKLTQINRFLDDRAPKEQVQIDI